MTNPSPQAAGRTVAVLQPSYLPWLGYVDQMRRADVFVLYDDVQFDKHGWRNRNRIKASNGQGAWLTVPVLHKGLSSQRIADTQINNDTNWRRKQIMAMRQAYARAPHVDRYLPELEELLNRPWELLFDLTWAALERIVGWLSIKSRIVRSSELGIVGDKSERLLLICQHFQATRYLSGNAAQDYLDLDLFQRSGVEIVWQDYKHPVYSQQHGSFLSHLSIVDLLFNCGEESAAILAGQQIEAA